MLAKIPATGIIFMEMKSWIIIITEPKAKEKATAGFVTFFQ